MTLDFGEKRVGEQRIDPSDGDVCELQNILGPTKHVNTFVAIIKDSGHKPRRVAVSEWDTWELAP